MSLCPLYEHTDEFFNGRPGRRCINRVQCRRLSPFSQHRDFHVPHFIFHHAPIKYCCRPGQGFSEHMHISDELVHAEQRVDCVNRRTSTSVQNAFMRRTKHAGMRLGRAETTQDSDITMRTRCKSTIYVWRRSSSVQSARSGMLAASIAFVGWREHQKKKKKKKKKKKVKPPVRQSSAYEERQSEWALTARHK